MQGWGGLVNNRITDGLGKPSFLKKSVSWDIVPTGGGLDQIPTSLLDYYWVQHGALATVAVHHSDENPLRMSQVQ